ncbi:hypothetical protein LOTGIDRAFT_178826 [Lottia gigantea]|uniref:unspecific monooxygenase n=1 Tax=Lottia gigantea TaxID=225164 RepID=V3ZH96_LOTGI|nr:hypothetical protein LOTGIDRAFT_178826 [Lottia gigantea]ESO90623.1 hypothetical protein LOTGIDRAFT_178826 [Lottia gigantea]
MAITYFSDTSNLQASLATFVVTLIGAKIVLHLIQKDNAPPGPQGLPLLGYLPFFGEFPYKTFKKLRRQYGDIFSVQMGSFPAVVLNGRELIKEALVNRGDDFSGRPNFYSSQVCGPEALLLQYSDITVLHRKLATNYLQKFTEARHNPIEEMVNDEVRIASSEFADTNGKPFYPRDIIFQCVGSVIFQICYGRDVNIREENPSFVEFTKSSSDFTQFVASGNPVEVMPYLRYVMPWKVTKFKQIMKRLVSIRINQVKEIMKSYRPGHMRHLADGLISAYQEEKNKPDSVFTEQRVFKTLDEITGAGFESIATTLTWTVLMLAAHPEIQEKAHQEIERVIGKRQPKLMDKFELNYCQALVNEVMRFTNIVPLSFPHAATKDTELAGYTIRKGTVVIPNLHSISHDPELWGDPDTFRPDRYLDSNSLLDKSSVDKFSVFSIGRRKCLGETLARKELFLFTVGMLQHCKFTKPDHIKEYTFASCKLGHSNPRHLEQRVRRS